MINHKVSVEELNRRFKTNMLAQLDITFTGIGDDYVAASMPVDERTQQPRGILHGGASVTLAETLGSVGANLCLDQDNQYCVGLEINANHVRSMTTGYVYGRAEIVHLGKKTQIWEIRINNEADKLVCISRITMAVIEKNRVQ